ncbi:MAG: family 20 glycosylhydrolase [Planctomycetota bacterium]|jgi:hexosaminidase|nr:family 20 glycosylhydrolase [Planctomycetota bacterium]
MTFEALIPVPRAVTPLSGQVRVPTGLSVSGGKEAVLDAEWPGWTRGDAVSIHHEPEGQPESYQLRLTPDAIRIVHADELGLRHALRSLRQLAGTTFAAAQIDDAPLLPWRGVMLDISRDRVPTQRELERVVDIVADTKGNALQLYVEHSFSYHEHHAVWRDASPITGLELQALDAYAAARGVSLIANQNCFGHMERWLAEPAYADLAELPAICDILRAGDPTPKSLCSSDPAALALVTSLLDEQVPCVRSGMVNIGCDETWDLGEGRSADAVAARGVGRVFGDYVADVVKHCQSRGWQAQFWADMALDHLAAFDRVPAEALALAWGYEADSDFERWGEVLCERDRAWWACPGTASWRSVYGRPDARDGSIAAAVAAADAFGASGLLVTDWGDCGHRQQWPVAAVAQVSGLAAAWSGATPATTTLGEHALGTGGGAAAAWLDELAGLERDVRASAPHPLRAGPLINAGVVFSDAHLPWGRSDWLPELLPWLALREQVAALAAQRPAIDNALVARELDHTAAVALAYVERACARRGGSGDGAAWNARWAEIETDFAALWDERCRPGGRADALRWYQVCGREARERWA